MPHADLKYSADIGLDAPAILARIEAVIQSHDAGAGECKGRAFPAEQFHHSHVLVDISMLPKPHRDPDFMHALSADLEQGIKAMIPVRCFFSLNIGFSGAIYTTGLHSP